MRKKNNFLDPKEKNQLEMLKSTLLKDGVDFDTISHALQDAIKEHAFSEYVQTNNMVCPSTPVSDDAFVFGVLDEEVEVKYIQNPIPMTNRLREVLNEIETPQRHFRFTRECNKCSQWDHDHCSVATLVKRASDDLQDENIPACGIRKHCRWFLQEGLSVCRLCKFTVTRY